MNPKFRLLLVCLVVLVGITGLHAQAPEGDRERGIKGRPLAEPEAPTKPEPGPVAEAAALRLIRLSGALRPEASGLGQPRTGVVGVTFALYKEQRGGAPLWLETQNVELGADGRYTVLLGATHNEGLPLEIFASEEARWLEVTVQGDPESRPEGSGFGTGEQARILLVSVPYALKAADAERLGGKPAEAFLLAAPAGEESEKSRSGQGQALSSGGDGTLAQVVSGTVGQIAKFTATDTVQDSIITETGGADIGVGTTSPMGKLHVQKTGALTKLVVGNPNPVANNAADGFIQIFGEHNGVVKSAFIQNIGDSLQINGAGAGVNVQLLGQNETSILNGTFLGVYDATNAKRLYIKHDGTRVLFSTSGTNAGGMAFRPVANLTTAFQFQVAGGATTVLGIDTTNQRVGIGTPSPQARLHITQGDLRLGAGARTNFVDASDDAEIYTASVPFEGNEDRLGQLVIQPRTSQPRDIVFAASSDGLNTDERMRIRAGGGVSVTGNLTAGDVQTSGISSTGAAHITGSLSLGAGGQTNFLVDASDDAVIYRASDSFEGNVNQLGTLVIQPRTSVPRDIIFATSSDGLTTEARVRIGSNGHVGIGTTNTTPQLYVQNGATGLLASPTPADGIVGECSTQSCFGITGISLTGPAITGISNDGNGVNGNSFFGTGVLGVSSTGVGGDFDRTDNDDLGPILMARNGSDIEFKVLGNGNVFADGAFTGGGADFAELIEPAGAKEMYEPGDVLVIDASGNRRVTRSHEAYSPLVAGIYSTKPGLLGRQWEDDDPRLAEEIPMAIVGIVPCKVSAENGAIEPGDLLVTSSTAGHAMKGTDRSRMLGAIVGKALEPFAGPGTAVIQVLVTLQ